MALAFLSLVMILFPQSRREVFTWLVVGCWRVITALTVFLLIVGPFAIVLLKDKIVLPPPGYPLPTTRLTWPAFSFPDKSGIRQRIMTCH